MSIDDADTVAFADEFNATIDKRYALHAQQLATRGNVESVRKDIVEINAELIKAIAESQRWTVTAIFAAVGIFAALIKVLS